MTWSITEKKTDLHTLSSESSTHCGTQTQFPRCILCTKTFKKLNENAKKEGAVQGTTSTVYLNSMSLPCPEDSDL